MSKRRELKATVTVELTAEVVADWFWQKASDEQARVFELIALHANEDYHDWKRRRPAHEACCRFSPDFQWFSVGRDVADLDADFADEFVESLYRGMLHRKRQRLNEWVRSG